MALHRCAASLLLCVTLVLLGACERPRRPADCGASGEPCCSGAACDDGLVCTAAVCQTPAADAGVGVDAGPDDNWSQWPAPPDIPPDSEYVVSADGSTATDSVTGLVWQRAVPANPCPADGTGVCTWQDALKYCAELNLGGVSSGWRLPTMVELVSILDLGVYDPAVDSTIFPGTPSAGFWTSSSYASEGGGAWVVGFDNGATSGIGNEGSGAVRCVR